jgi:mRNA interferase MazF
MAAPAIRSVVVVRFPFSDISRSKVRPAIVLCDVGRGDFLLCQVTSKPYGDTSAIRLDAQHFQSGGLERTSHARPGKLFTANNSIVGRQVGVLTSEACRTITDRIALMLREGHL